MTGFLCEPCPLLCFVNLAMIGAKAALSWTLSTKVPEKICCWIISVVLSVLMTVLLLYLTLLLTVSEPGNERKLSREDNLGCIYYLFVFQIVASSSYMFQKGGPMFVSCGKHSGCTRLFPSEKSPALCGVSFHPVTQEMLVGASLSLQVLSSWDSQTVAFAVSLLSHIKKKAGTAPAVLVCSEALTKYNRPGDLESTETYFSYLSLETLSSRQRQIPYLVRCDILRDSTLFFVLPGDEGKNGSQGLLV